MKKLFATLLFYSFTIAVSASPVIFDFLKNSSEEKSASVLLIFFRDDCPYCQKMSNEMQKEQEFSRLLEQKFNIQ